MQTFLPYADFVETAKCLDYKRLGKQRVEAYQILEAILYGKGWIHHPATLMWVGYDEALVKYGIAICQEWRNRGYKDTMLEKFEALRKSLVIYPPWLGKEIFHASHRSNLLHKNPEYYSQFNWKEKDNLEYYWPVRGK